MAITDTVATASEQVPLFRRLSERRRLLLAFGVLAPGALAGGLFAATYVDGRAAVVWGVTGVLAMFLYTFFGEDMRAEHARASAVTPGRADPQQGHDPTVGPLLVFCAGYGLLTLGGFALRYAVL